MRDDPHAALLLADAQSSGGLLVAVAPREAARITAALHRAEVAAARIGTVVAGPVRITVDP